MPIKISFMLGILLVLMSSPLSSGETESNVFSGSNFNIDIDGNGHFDALTDGVIIVRSMFGLRGNTLVSGAIANDAVFTSPVDIESRIDQLGMRLDIDNNGTIDALTDGLLILRHLFGLDGNKLIDQVIDTDARRASTVDIEYHLESLTSLDQSWQKGSLHSHSLWSDGDDFPEMIIKWHKENDYQFVAISDHNSIADDENYWHELNVHDRYNKSLEKYRDSFGDWVEVRNFQDKEFVRLKTFDEYKSKMEEDGSFVVIRAEEVTARYNDKQVHINVTNIKDKISPPDGSSVLDIMQKTLDMALAQREKFNESIFAHINHPNLNYSVSIEDLKKLNGERFFEVYNGHPSSNNNGDDLNFSLEEMWDLINIDYYKNNKPLLFGLATDDSHKYHAWSSSRSNPGRGWVMVDSKKVEKLSLISALEAGNFYSSTGIELEKIQHNKEKFVVKIKPRSGVDYEIVFFAYQQDNSGVKEVQRVQGTSAQYAYNPKDLFVRVKINSNEIKDNPYVDGEYTQAWLQPVIVN